MEDWLAGDLFESHVGGGRSASMVSLFSHFLAFGMLMSQKRDIYSNYFTLSSEETHTKQGGVVWNTQVDMS